MPATKSPPADAKLALPRLDAPVAGNFLILGAVSFSHMLNDTIQSLVPAIYPIIKESLNLNFSQVGIIAVVFTLTASLLQPVIGGFTDKRPQTYAMAAGMAFTLAGLLALYRMQGFGMLLVSVALIGVGSSIFHPESSRVADMASGGKRGLAQSIFQLGGTFGGAMGPLLAALIVTRWGAGSLAWFGIIPVLGMLVLAKVGIWKRNHEFLSKSRSDAHHPAASAAKPSPKVLVAFGILVMLIFSKYFYLAGISSYFTFYLIDQFHVPLRTAQLFLVLFLIASAAGTLIGGPMGDRFGRKYVIWGSILGVAPFSLMLPHVNLFWTGVLLVPIGVILASAFSSILVYGQEMLPGKVGLVSGMFFGLAFGMGGLGSALLGVLADRTDIRFVFEVCAFLPLIGLLAVFLPDTRNAKAV